MALKHVPKLFNVDSENEVRFAVTSYFLELDFVESEISFEDYFSVRLGHRNMEISATKKDGLLRGYSDILITRNGKNLAVIETKGPDKRLTEADAEQAISYARLLLQIAPFAIVTNGRETKVYDVFADELRELETPVESAWEKNGRQTSPIGEHLRFDAARRLIRFNPEAIIAFCKAQLENGLSHVRGTIEEGRFYIPELFVPRSQIESRFEEWLESEMPVFAIVGDSGTGKTNSMCSLAEQASENHLVLFYQAIRMKESIVADIQEDFIWEFHADKHISFFIQRLSEFAESQDRRLLIFVDGLDEFDGSKTVLQNELTDLVERVRNLPVKVCISCKAFNWENFVVDRGQTFNEFAKCVFPGRDAVHQPTKYSRPKAEDVGMQLGDFSQEEKDAAFQKYRSAYDLSGDLIGDMAKECAFPLMMRLAAEAFQGTELRLSSSFSNIEIFTGYLDNRLNRVNRNTRSIARKILKTLSSLSIASGERFVDVSALEGEMSWSAEERNTFYELCRLNFLRLLENETQERVTFSFERIRAYVYTTMTHGVAENRRHY